MASCQIYLTRDAFFVLAQNRTVEGFYVTTGPMMKVDRGADDELLGRLALLALERSIEGIEAPSEPKSVTQALTRFLGSRSWKVFAKGAQLVRVEKREEESVLVPYRRIDDSFEPAEERAVHRGLVATEIGVTAKDLLGNQEATEG